MLVDFRKINEHTATDGYIIPNVNIIFQNLGKAKFFTTLYLKSGFYQIKMKVSDREKTAFCVNRGKYTNAFWFKEHTFNFSTLFG